MAVRVRNAAPQRDRNVPDNDYDSDPIHSIADPDNPLQGPKSRYWMFCLWKLFPEDTPDEHQRYETMPDAIRELFLTYEGISILYFRAARWKAEIAPSTRHCHVQCFAETKNKRLKRLEVLAFLHPLTMPWHLDGCEPINPYCPLGAWHYIGKPQTTMPGARIFEFGPPPPPGLFPRKGGKREGAGSKQNCNAEDFKLIMENCGRNPVESWLPQLAPKMKVGEVVRIVSSSRTPRFLGFKAKKYNTWIYSTEGNIGKTSAAIGWCERNRKSFLPLSMVDGFFGKWALGWNFPDALGLNEFTGNWLLGFHDFLAFLDNQMERILEVKGLHVCSGCRFTFINGNVAPENCLWIFPPSKIPRVAEPHELLLLYRRFNVASLVGGGLIEWDNEIPVEESDTQNFLWDLHMIREHEQLQLELGDNAGHLEFLRLWARVDEGVGARAAEEEEAADFMRRVVDRPVGVMNVLAELAAEEHNREEDYRLRSARAVADPPPEEILDLDALPDETPAQALRQERIQFPRRRYVIDEADEGAGERTPPLEGIEEVLG